MPKLRLQEGKKLSDQQERFCQEYATHHSGKRAAMAAGYPESDAKGYAFRLRHDPKYKHVQERLRELEEQNIDELGITKVQLRDDIQAILDDPNESTANKLKALRLKGQLIGAFTETVDHTLSLTPEMIESMKRVLDSE